MNHLTLKLITNFALRLISFTIILSGCSTIFTANTEISAEKWEKYCEKKTVQECYNHGVMQIRVNNVKDAKEIFRLTCFSGHGHACNNLGSLELRNGNEKEALKLFSNACKYKSGGGCSNLACMLGKGPCVGGQMTASDEVIDTLEKSCDYKFGPGCYNLGQAYIMREQEKKAMKAFEKACVLNEADGCYKLGMLQLNKYDDGGYAAPAFKKACKLGNSISCLTSGTIFEGDQSRAKGGPSDLTEGQSIYE